MIASGLPALLLGLAFGFALDRAGLTRKESIVGIFRFSDGTVLRFLLAGLAAGALLLELALVFHLTSSLPVPPTRGIANLTGGALFGIAMGAGGFCSGTILAALGSGRKDALPALLGLLAGAWLGDLCHPWIEALRSAGPGVTGRLSDWLGVDAWYLVALLVEVTLLVGYVLERGSRAVGATPPVPGGVDESVLSAQR